MGENVEKIYLDYEGLDKLERVRRLSENHLERRSVWI